MGGAGKPLLHQIPCPAPTPCPGPAPDTRSRPLLLSPLPPCERHRRRPIAVSLARGFPARPAAVTSAASANGGAARVGISSYGGRAASGSGGGGREGGTGGGPGPGGIWPCRSVRAGPCPGIGRRGSWGLAQRRRRKWRREGGWNRGLRRGGGGQPASRGRGGEIGAYLGERG